MTEIWLDTQLFLYHTHIIWHSTSIPPQKSQQHKWHIQQSNQTYLLSFRYFLNDTIDSNCRLQWQCHGIVCLTLKSTKHSSVISKLRDVIIMITDIRIYRLSTNPTAVSFQDTTCISHSKKQITAKYALLIQTNHATSTHNLQFQLDSVQDGTAAQGKVIPTPSSLKSTQNCPWSSTNITPVEHSSCCLREIYQPHPFSTILFFGYWMPWWSGLSLPKSLNTSALSSCRQAVMLAPFLSL